MTRICRAIRAESEDGKVSQIVYYQAGVGTGNSLWEKYFGGATGLGLAENCREAYSFLAHNYRAGDQIILIGFSRGAFTARSIADLIGCIGLLTKKGLGCFYEIFLDYENRRNPKYVPKFPNIPFENRPSFSDPRYTKELEAVRGSPRSSICGTEAYSNWWGFSVNSPDRKSPSRRLQCGTPLVGDTSRLS